MLESYLNSKKNQVKDKIIRKKVKKQSSLIVRFLVTLGSKLQQQNVIKTKSVKLFLSTWTKVQMNQAVSPKIDFAAVLLIKNVRG